MGLSVRRDEARLVGQHHRLRAVTQPQFGEDACDVPETRPARSSGPAAGRRRPARLSCLVVVCRQVEVL